MVYALSLARIHVAAVSIVFGERTVPAPIVCSHSVGQISVIQSLLIGWVSSGACISGEPGMCLLALLAPAPQPPCGWSHGRWAAVVHVTLMTVVHDTPGQLGGPACCRDPLQSLLLAMKYEVYCIPLNSFQLVGALLSRGSDRSQPTMNSLFKTTVLLLVRRLQLFFSTVTWD